MTSRQKKGIGFLVTGTLFLAAGIVFTFFATTPDWLSVTFECVAAVGNVIGMAITLPTLTSDSKS